MYSDANKAYDIIDRKASSNVLIQGLSGIAGVPFTLFADVGTVFSHYGPMFNEIRAVYGHAPVDGSAISAFLSGCKQELVSDVVVDKVLGNIPLIGLPANMIAAKSMTWRTGIVVGMLSARGEEINPENVKKATLPVRQMFPQRESLSFRKPTCKVVCKLPEAVEELSVEEMDDRVSKALDLIAS